MKPENKKIAIYIGGAVVVGAIGFFVYSFFQKPIIVGENSSIDLDNDDEEKKQSIFEPTSSSKTNTFFSNLQSSVFEPIKTPNIFKSAIAINPLELNTK